MVDTAGTYQELAERFGLEREIGGGGSEFLSVYLPSGAYVWATDAGGIGMPTSESFYVCAYPAGWDGEDELLARFNSEYANAPTFEDALTAAIKAARTGIEDRDSMTSELVEFCEAHRLPLMSADELWHELQGALAAPREGKIPAPTSDAERATREAQAAYVWKFWQRWEAMESAEETPLEDAPLWQREHGDIFDAAPWPAVPAGFEDASWHNDATARLWSDAERLSIWCNPLDIAKREVPDQPRYILAWERETGNAGDPVDFHDIAASDDWADILHALTAHRVALQFSENLRDTLGAERVALIVAENAAEPMPDVCHTHDHCDANMPMADAFETVTGLECEPEIEAHCILWNRAWSMAKARGFAVDEEPSDDGDEPCPVNRRPKSTCPDGCDHGEESGALVRFREGRATVADAEELKAAELDAGRPCPETLFALDTIIAHGGDQPGESVLALFAERFPNVGMPADIAAGLAKCPTASGCGVDCMAAIVAADALADALRKAHGSLSSDDVNRLGRDALKACTTFYFG